MNMFLENMNILGNIRRCNWHVSIKWLPWWNLPSVWETQVWSLGWEDSLEKGMATHSSILAWRITLTKEPGRPQSMGSQSVGHYWVAFTFTFHFHKMKRQNKTLPTEKAAIKTKETSAFKIILIRSIWDFLVVQWLTLCAPNEGWDLGLIPGQGTRSQMPQLRPGAAK